MQPILFLIFNRLDTTKQVLSVIRQVKPKQLFIAADGPRPNVPADEEKCISVRKYVVENIDWDCEVKTLFRDTNLGCGKAVAGAITWFFENVEQGIILEDDIIPSLSFFTFCDALLEMYKDNEQVFHIGGYNQRGVIQSDESYVFTSYPSFVWGWATWRRAWKYYNHNIEGLDDFIEQGILEKIHTNPQNIYGMKKILRQMERHHHDSWAYLWQYTNLRNNGLCIIPTKNMTVNIGFGEDATHTNKINKKVAELQRYEIENIIHPSYITDATKPIPITLSMLRQTNGYFNDFKRLNPVIRIARSIWKRVRKLFNVLTFTK